MWLELPAEFVYDDPQSIEAIQGNFRDDKEVFQRAMQEIPLKAAGYEDQAEADKAMIEYYKENGIKDRLPTIAE